MANTKISALTSATTPLAGTETLPIVQSSTTKQVSVANLTAGRAVTMLSGAIGAANAKKTLAVVETTSASTTPGTNPVVWIGGGTGSTSTLSEIGFTYGFTGAYTETYAPVTIGYQLTSGSGYTKGDIVFTTRNVITDTAPTEQFRIMATGDVTVKTGNIIPSTAAKGINFTANTPAAGKTSQLLNWYEEGTWTPTVTGSTTNPTVSYSLQRGRYTRIGRLVTLECYLSWSSLSGGSGNAQISGLPFTVDGSTGAYGGGAISLLDGVTFYAGRTAANVQPQASTSNLYIYQFGSLVTSSATAVSQLSSAGSIVFTITYSV